MADPTRPPADRSQPSPDPRPAPVAPITVREFQDLIFERYYPTDSKRGAAGTFLLFMEEVGELATSLHECGPGKTPTPAQRANLGEEFVDVFAWLATLANIHGVDLTAELKKYTTPGKVTGTKD